MLVQNQATIQSLAQDYREMRNELSDYSARLSTVENSHACLSKNCASEINQLKELRRRGASTAELKVTGIPADNTTAFPDLAKKLLSVLKLQELCVDILEVHEIQTKIVKLTEDAASANGIVPTDNGRNKYKGFIVKFKSQVISQHVLKCKRQHGIIKFKDLVADGADNIVSVYEMVPPFLNELRILARDKATERGYKHVWPANGCIYVKKTDTSVPIVISTEHDLSNIV